MKNNIAEKKWDFYSKQLIIIISLVLISLLVRKYYLIDIDKLQKKVYTQKSQEINKQFKQLMEIKKGYTANLTYLLSLNKDINNILLKNENHYIDYNNISKKFKNFSQYKNIWIQIIDKNGVSKYRSWTSLKNDNLFNVRSDIQQMIQDPKPMNHISTGKFDMTFKTMIPIYDNKNFIGIIEMISHFNSIALDLLQNNIESIVIVNKEYSKKIIKPFNNLYIDEHYISNKKASPILIEKMKNEGLDKFLNIKNYLLDDEYLITSHPIKDIHKHIMGYNLMFYKKQLIDMSLIHKYNTSFLFNIVIVLILLLIIISIIILKKYIKNLHSDIKDKDNDLEIKNNKLLDLIESYDKNVIFSKTNMHGVITDVSNAFCDISGYSKKELIGNQHNIVRHPDMPSSLFTNIWKTIKSDKTWEGEIKNLRQNGSYYWTKAVIVPDLDRYGNLIGYYAIRHDITALKDFEEQQKYLIQSEKLASMGEMIGNIAHQWRQPLSIISTAATGIQMQKEFDMLTDEMFDKSCSLINENTQYLSKTIDDFRNFLKGDSIKQKFHLANTIDSFINLVKPSIQSHDITVEVNTKEAIELTSFENELIQCLINIFNNAKDALLELENTNKHILVNITKNSDNIAITIQDNAGGIPDNIIEKVFEPYFTTKDKAQGTGLGLHMSYKLVSELMMGTISVSNRSYLHNDEKHKGAHFIITLPVK